MHNAAVDDMFFAFIKGKITFYTKRFKASYF